MSVQTLIAHYLKQNGYHETLAVFQKEHGKILDTEPVHGESLSQIVADRKVYVEAKTKDSVVSDEKALQRKTLFRNWCVPYPNLAKEILAPLHLIVDSAIFETAGKYALMRYALMATASKSLVVVDLDSGKTVFKVENPISVVIRHVCVHNNKIFLCGMDGKLIVGTLDLETHTFHALIEHQLHSRLVVDIKIIEWSQKTYLVSMGTDSMVKVFSVGEKIKLEGEFRLSSPGSCIDALVHNNSLYILACKQDITLMDVLCLESSLSLKFRIALNDAEFSATGFSPRSISVLHQDPPLVAIATSHEPYMRAVILSFKEENDPEKILRSQIVSNLNTLSPQDKYSNARIQWRNDGSGLWIAGEDGTIRGLDVLAEKVVVAMDGHEGRIRSMCFWKDTLLTCGIDKKVKYWS